MNLVDLAMKELSGGTLSQIANAIGLPSDKSNAALGAAVPTIFAGLAKLSSTGEGASRLDAALTQHGPSLSGGLGQMLSAAGGSESILSKGTSLLDGLFGGSKLGSIVDILGKFSGVAGPTLKKLLAMAAPAILRMLFQQKREQGLDAGGIGRLLAGQKDHIAAAMPSGLGSLLSASGMLDAGLGAASRTAQAAAQEGGSMLKKLLPLVILLGLGLLAWQLFFNKAKNATEAVVTTIGGVDLPAAYGTTLGKLKTTLSGITDVASAKAAVPALTELEANLGKYAGLWAGAPEAVKTAVSGKVKDLGLVPTLRATIEKILALPGVSDVLKPVFEKLLATMKSFA